MKSQGLFPNFFIIGTVKASTTSLYNYLNLHPDVFMSPIKEPHYFATDIRVKDFRLDYAQDSYLDFKKYFARRPLKEHAVAHIESEDDYKQLYLDVDSEKAIGEASTSYLFSQDAAKNIHAKVPNAKIIVILRNPVERAFSHYLMDVKSGDQHRSFLDAFYDDLHMSKKGWGISNLYLELSLYTEQLQCYYDLFPASQIKVLFFDDLNKNPTDFLKSVFEFLELDSAFYDFSVTKQKYNDARVPRFPKIFFILWHSNYIRQLYKLFPARFKSFLLQLLFTKDIPKLTAKDKKEIFSYFREDIAKLEQLIGKSLKHWNCS